MARKKEEMIEIGRATRFSSTTQPTNRGRKKSLYKRLKELVKKNDVQLTKEDFCKIVNHLLDMPIAEVKKIGMDEATPIWVVCIVRAIIADASSGVTKTLDSLFDRLFGKAIQPTKDEISLQLKGSIPIHKWIEDKIEE